MQNRFLIILRGPVLGVVRKSRVIHYLRVLLYFYDKIFRNRLRGYMRCPPPPSPVCIYDNKIKPDSEEGWLFSGRACLRLHLERVDVAEAEHGRGDAPRQAGDGANSHHEANDQHVQVVAAAFLLKIKILSLGKYDQLDYITCRTN